jgi:hypothetical protein
MPVIWQRVGDALSLAGLVRACARTLSSPLRFLRLGVMPFFNPEHHAEAQSSQEGNKANPNYSFHDRAMKRPFLPESTCKARSTLRVRAAADFSQEK